MKNPRQTLMLVVIVIVAIIMLLNVFSSGMKMGSLMGKGPQRYTVGEFLGQVQEGNIKNANWQMDQITGKLKNGSDYVVNAVPYDGSLGTYIIGKLNDSKVNVNTMPAPISVTILQVLSFLAVPLIIVAVFWFFVYRPAQMGGNQAMSFGKSKARRGGRYRRGEARAL